MKQCTRIPLKITFPTMVLEAALVKMSDSPIVKLFVKRDSRELSFEVYEDLVDNPDPTVIQAELEDFLDELVQQAKLDFPSWLEEFSTEMQYVDQGTQSPAVFEFSKIKRYWSEKQLAFGMFRIAAELGIISDKSPSNAKVIYPISIDVGLKNTYSVKG